MFTYIPFPEQLEMGQTTVRAFITCQYRTREAIEQQGNIYKRMYQFVPSKRVKKCLIDGRAAFCLLYAQSTH